MYFLFQQTWEFLSQHVVRKHIVSLAVPRLPVDPESNQSSAYPRHNLILGFADGCVRALNRYGIATGLNIHPGLLFVQLQLLYMICVICLC